MQEANNKLKIILPFLSIHGKIITEKHLNNYSNIKM